MCSSITNILKLPFRPLLLLLHIILKIKSSHPWRTDRSTYLYTRVEIELSQRIHLSLSRSQVFDLAVDDLLKVTNVLLLLNAHDVNLRDDMFRMVAHDTQRADDRLACLTEVCSALALMDLSGENNGGLARNKANIVSNVKTIVVNTNIGHRQINIDGADSCIKEHEQMCIFGY